MIRAFSIVFVTVLAVVSVFFVGCGHQRVLTVKSEPADAEVCIKGKHGSHYFPSNKKTCVGSTPYESDKIEWVDGKGETHEVSFADVEDDRENFYILINRPGYATQSVQVPAWDHFLALKPDATAPGAAGGVTVIQQAPLAATPQVDQSKGGFRVTSNPSGALVYINDVLKGNTPYALDGVAGTSVRIKLEQNGYRSTEKTVVIDGGKTLDLNLALIQETGAPSTATAARSIASEVPTQQAAPQAAPQMAPQVSPTQNNVSVNPTH